MHYSEEILDQIRRANDIVDVVGASIHLTHRGSSFVACCPFHSEKTPSFNVNRNLQIYKCFGCGKSGNVISFVMDYENYSFVEAVKFLAERAGIRLPEVDESEQEQRDRSMREKLYEINKAAATYFFKKLRAPEGADAMKYLADRGLDRETMQRFGLGYGGRASDGLYMALKEQGYSDALITKAGLANLNERGALDRFWNRVMYPILDVNGKVIAFGGRVMGSPANIAKYINSAESPIFEKGRNLYGLHLARRSRRGYFILAEGYMDVIALHRAGFDNAVASLGTALTPMQAKIIARYTKQAIISYDSDGAGTNAALRAIPILREAGLSVKVLNMKPYKDPDEFMAGPGSEEYEKRIADAKNGFAFRVDVMRDRNDMNDPDERTNFVNMIASMLTEYTDPIERESYIHYVSGRYNINEDALKAKVNDKGNEAIKRREFQEAREEQTVRAKAAKRDEGIVKSQKLLLTLMASEPTAFREFADRIGPEDFMGDMASKVASLAFEQYRKNSVVKPATIIDRFDDPAERDEAGSFFMSALPDDMSADQNRKAILDTLKRVRLDALDERMQQAMAAGDGELCSKLMLERTKLQ